MQLQINDKLKDFWYQYFFSKIQGFYGSFKRNINIFVGIFVCTFIPINTMFTGCGSFLMKQSLRQSQWLQNSLSILKYIHVSINSVLVSVISSAVLLDMALGAPIHLRHSWISLTTDNFHFAKLFKQNCSTCDPKRLRFVIYLWQIQKHLNRIYKKKFKSSDREVS